MSVFLSIKSSISAILLSAYLLFIFFSFVSQRSLAFIISILSAFYI